ncbi:hypothetical protein [Massilia sp. TSP1-1-2]|uniref:hypothetical protein n=1 Tax=Massilia sp. TSP1-1-2 TaxID=2804649 RepID=UPI003CF465FD
MRAVQLLLGAAMLSGACCQAAQAAPPLDLSIAYYSRVTTPEGVTREARYQDSMLRRPGHVWVTRVLPAGPAPARPAHAEFNPVLLARHVMLQQGKVSVEFVDRRGRERVAVPPAEYANVGFDGSWENAASLLDPRRVMSLPLSARPSPVAGAQWRERERDGMFERVLWDAARELALVIESGDKAATVFKRVQVTVQPGLAPVLPWTTLAGYAHKEYADFLD